MTAETNSVLNTVKQAFAPVTEAFTKLQNLEVPEAAREFVKKQTETAKISRNIQDAIYQDAEAFFAGIDKLASAKSLNEAVQIQSDMLRARGEVLVSRAKASTEYLGKLVADGAKSAQDNFAKVYNKTA